LNWQNNFVKKLPRRHPVTSHPSEISEKNSKEVLEDLVHEEKQLKIFAFQGLQTDVITYNSAIRVASGHWEVALSLLDEAMHQGQELDANLGYQ